MFHRITAQGTDIGPQRAGELFYERASDAQAFGKGCILPVLNKIHYDRCPPRLVYKSAFEAFRPGRRYKP